MLTNKGDRIVQICLVVEDLDRAIDHWIDTMGAGPFFMQKNLVVPIKYRGEPADIDIHVGLGQSGPIQIELIQVASDRPSVYRESFPHGGGGFHHVAVFVDDIEHEIEVLAAAGSPLGCRGDFAGTPFAYVDTRATCGYFTELYQEAEGLRGFYRAIAAAADGWDRSVRTLPLTAALP